jgi:hypothetical protein
MTLQTTHNEAAPKTKDFAAAAAAVEQRKQEDVRMPQ